MNKLQSFLVFEKVEERFSYRYYVRSEKKSAIKLQKSKIFFKYNKAILLRVPILNSTLSYDWMYDTECNQLRVNRLEEDHLRNSILEEKYLRDPNLEQIP